jgi:glycosyltransferase involved in cell wall biosynthesis
MSIATEVIEDTLSTETFTSLVESAGHKTNENRIRQHYFNVPVERHVHGDSRRLLAMFCFENPNSVIGRFTSAVSAALVARHVPVHIFSREAFDIPGVHSHAVGDCPALDILGEVNEFTRRAANAYLRNFHGTSAQVTLMGHEWSSIPALSLLHGIKNVGAMLSLHSLERQRSGAMTEIGRRIEEIELAGIREAKAIFTQDQQTSEAIAKFNPDSVSRLIDSSPMIPLHQFEAEIDPGDVKARYQIGPTDPTILFVGDLSERYGPDLLIKALPSVLKKHPQARLVFVGDGDQAWPIRVYSRYLLLDHATRMPSHLSGQPLHELVQAADVVVAPSRESTPWWPVLAGWAARKPVVCTYQAASPLLENELDCLIVDPTEQSVAAGVNRILEEPEFAQLIASRGREKLEERCNWNVVAMHIEERMRLETHRGAEELAAV